MTDPSDDTDQLVDVDPSTIAGPIEALLLMATEPMSAAELAQALDVPKPAVWAALESLQRFYDERKGSRKSGQKTNQAGSGREGLARSTTESHG